jgi:hypothetical protein
MHIHCDSHTVSRTDTEMLFTDNDEPMSPQTGLLPQRAKKLYYEAETPDYDCDEDVLNFNLKYARDVPVAWIMKLVDTIKKEGPPNQTESRHWWGDPTEFDTCVLAHLTTTLLVKCGHWVVAEPNERPAFPQVVQQIKFIVYECDKALQGWPTTLHRDHLGYERKTVRVYHCVEYSVLTACLELASLSIMIIMCVLE